MHAEANNKPSLQDASGQADPKRTVKKYRRSAAGNEQPLPSDVRPPHVLSVRNNECFIVNIWITNTWTISIADA